MASEEHIFSRSGPSHLINSVDWENPDHRRSVAASLVQGVYVLEGGRRENRQGPQSHAPPWWQSFDFHLYHQLVDDVDSTIFGAIYYFEPHSCQGAPKYIIAFRGNVLREPSLQQDLKLDLQFSKNKLHQTSRFETAMTAVRNTVDEAGDLKIWLAGHSLGSALAMLAGKNMVQDGKFLDAFLFNPPYISAPLEMIKSKRLKRGIRVTKSVIKAGFSKVLMKGGYIPISTSEDPFVVQSRWVPCMFVNPADHIGSEYVGYFNHREIMKKIGAEFIEKLATKTSILVLILGAIGKESEPLHVLPSADLTVNRSPWQKFERVHGICQWWRQDLNLESKVYRYTKSSG